MKFAGPILHPNAGSEQQQFLSTLKDDRSAIADFISRCQHKQVAPEDISGMLKRAHRLSTTSVQFGYHAINEVAHVFTTKLSESAADNVLLPLAQALHSACHEALIFLRSPAPASNAAPIRAERTQNKPTILTADDDRAVRSMIEAILENDANIITASDGLSALEAITRHKPDLVILDDTMPGMTGLRLLEKLQDDLELCDTRVLMLSSNDRDQDFSRAFGAGALAYVLKPFDPHVLAAKVREILSHS